MSTITFTIDLVTLALLLGGGALTLLTLGICGLGLLLCRWQAQLDERYTSVGERLHSLECAVYDVNHKLFLLGDMIIDYTAHDDATEEQHQSPTGEKETLD